MAIKYDVETNDKLMNIHAKALRDGELLPYLKRLNKCEYCNGDSDFTFSRQLITNSVKWTFTPCCALFKADVFKALRVTEND